MTVKPLLVRAAHLLELPPDAPDNLRIRLQEQYGLDTRRLSPLSRLVLAGALPLCPKLPAHSAVYLTVPFGSIHNFKRMWDKLREYQQPSPLDFMAQLHNAPLFHLAQTAALHGETIVLTAEAASLLHILDLAAGALHSGSTDSILVGWAYERRQPDEPEISLWWHLTAGNPSDTTTNAPIAALPVGDSFPQSAAALHRQLLQHGALTLPDTCLWAGQTFRFQAA